MALPAPTPLANTLPYPVFTIRSYSWVPTIASRGAATLSELSAGTDLTKQVGAVSGFSLQDSTLDVPRAGQNFTGNLPGRSTASDSSLSLYVSQTGMDARSLFTPNLAGNIVIYTEGIVTGGHYSQFPSRVGSLQLTEDLEGVAMVVVTFRIYDAPAEYVTIPTA